MLIALKDDLQRLAIGFAAQRLHSEIAVFQLGTGRNLSDAVTSLAVGDGTCIRSYDTHGGPYQWFAVVIDELSADLGLPQSKSADGDGVAFYGRTEGKTLQHSVDGSGNIHIMDVCTHRLLLQVVSVVAEMVATTLLLNLIQCFSQRCVLETQGYLPSLCRHSQAGSKEDDEQ